MNNISERLSKIESIISDPKFLSNKGVANEVGIHIFQYDPQDEIIVRRFFMHLGKQEGKPFRLIKRDLYEIFLQICEDKRISGQIDKLEERRGSEYLLQNLHKTATAKDFISHMQYDPHNAGDILLITGVGKVYPFMRSHIILNNIQHLFSDIPVIMLYPGSYNGQSLRLFSEFDDDNYYRAFELI